MLDQEQTPGRFPQGEELMDKPLTTPEIMSIADQLDTAVGPGAVWTHTSEDLNVNLLAFDAGQGVPVHVNDERDVLIMVVSGEGVVEIDGVVLPIRAGQVCIIPKGVARAIRGTGGRFAYLSCHRRRGGLWPADPPRRLA
jgi:quercetin dioxygenase-like cupin family protein